MDFLDPKKKRSRQIRLAIGHALMVLLVFIATYILVFRAYGYDYDAKTGQVVQDGLVYIDSAPDGATITINGKAQKSNTNTRLSLPEGRYDLEISKAGYLNWKRSFDLDGGEVLRFAYPVLLPTDLKTDQLQTFKTPITFASQSPDRRWILLDEKNKLNSMVLYDLNRRTNDQPTSTSLSFPKNLFAPAEGNHLLKLAEWSTDNRHLLVQHNYKKGQEFVVLDIQQPDQSYNVNKTFNQNISQVSLFDKKFDKLFIYNAKTKVLSSADTKSKSVQSVVPGVISYKSHGDDTLLFSRASSTDKDMADIVMRQKDKDYVIKKVPLAKEIPLDIARYNDSWYVVIGVQSQKRSYVYKDPIDLLLNHQRTIKSIRAIVLRNSGPVDKVAFSQNARFILSHSGQNFSIYDAEEQQHFSYTLKDKLDPAQLPFWMDGHRLLASSGGKLLMFDYDGINLRTTIKTDPAMPAMFDRDYVEMYSLGPSTSDKGKYALFVTQLRLPTDK